ncbi:hypothetical protein Q5P01_002838 [Channa striata]|uniref:Uncharacterized protein n=1 Tax=Channa striata TaxID=64152 RepID=A0AA88NPY1_CHASR|nr:hypothetical protein Q5P01_002838 [Channa striata]
MMISLKTWSLLSLSALLLLSITPTETEVVKLLSQCDRFFLEQTPPQVPGSLEKGIIKNSNQYKAICQTYKDERRFVTLYDTKNKIPVFSAYKYRGEGPLDEDKKRPKNVPWKIEPQITSDPLAFVTFTSNGTDNDFNVNCLGLPPAPTPESPGILPADSTPQATLCPATLDPATLPPTNLCPTNFCQTT